MPTQSIEQHFSHRIEALISDFTGNTLLFFKGFGIQQIQQLIKHPKRILPVAKKFSPISHIEVKSIKSIV